MKEKLINLLLISSLLTVLLTLSGCEGCGASDTYPHAGTINLGMVNNSDREVHMWATNVYDNREKIGPENKLMVGEGRVAEICMKWENEATVLVTTVYVGWNGVAYASKTFSLTYEQYKKSCFQYAAKYSNSGDIAIQSSCPE